MSCAERRIEYPVAEPDIGPLELQYVTEAVRSGWVSSLGEFIGRFEKGMANLCDAKHVVTVCNGTVALHLTLKGLGIGSGDEVIVPSLTFVATAAAVLHAGATPVFVDSEPRTYCLEPLAVKAAMTARTKAIIVVHLYGHPANMDAILEIAAGRCAVIEDAAEAHGALYRGRRVGSIGRVGTFSFYANKLITTGEGGCVVTNDEELASRFRFLKDHAMDRHRRYWHPEVGYNYRMTNLQAALGVAQIERFDQIVRRRRALIDAYRDALWDLPVVVNPAEEWAEPAPWLANMLLPPGKKASVVAQRLRQIGIDTRPFFVPLNQMPPYRSYRCVDDSGRPGCPISADLHERGIILPTVPSMPVEPLLDRVSQAVKACIATD